MKARGTVNDLTSLEQDLAALDVRFFQRIKRGKMPRGNAFIGQWPETFAGLSFRRRGGQKKQVEALWNVHVGTGMPPGLIHDQSDLLLRARANGTCKLRQCQIHRLDGDRGQDQPLSTPRLGMHEAVEIHPFIPLLDVDRGTRSFAHPNSPQKRFQANAMFIHGPHLDAGLGMLGLDLFHILARFFSTPPGLVDRLSRGEDAAPACSLWRRRRYSQPNWGWTVWPVCSVIQIATLGPEHHPPSGGSCSKASCHCCCCCSDKRN